MEVQTQTTKQNNIQLLIRYFKFHVQDWLMTPYLLIDNNSRMGATLKSYSMNKILKTENLIIKKLAKLKLYDK